MPQKLRYDPSRLALLALRLYPAHPGNPRNRIQGESPPLKKGHTVFAALRGGGSSRDGEAEERYPGLRIVFFVLVERGAARPGQVQDSERDQQRESDK